jgi:Cu+-exporting ATPase
MQSQRENEKIHIDPVCGMEVDPSDAAGTSTIGGKTFYFCAQSCKERFDANPAEFGVTPRNRQSH